MTKNSESPAFPFIVHEGKEDQWHATGLTKREHIATQCLQGMLAGKVQVVSGGSSGQEPNAMAKVAVAYADALLQNLEA